MVSQPLNLIVVTVAKHKNVLTRSVAALPRLPRNRNYVWHVRNGVVTAHDAPRDMPAAICRWLDKDVRGPGRVDAVATIAYIAAMPMVPAVPDKLSNFGWAATIVEPGIERASIGIL
jgi:hypothetical protein